MDHHRPIQNDKNTRGDDVHTPSNTIKHPGEAMMNTSQITLVPIQMNLLQMPPGVMHSFIPMPTAATRFASLPLRHKYVAPYTVEGLNNKLSISSPEMNNPFKKKKHEEEVLSCTCKNSQCLKLYCKCFSAKSFCGDQCKCIDCKNDGNADNVTVRNEAIKAVLIRNPEAFENKFRGRAGTSSSGSCEKKGDVKQVEHRFGCKCRKSACLKKYCECYNAGVKCSGNCRCVNCHNQPSPDGNDARRKDHTLEAITSTLKRAPTPAQSSPSKQRKVYNTKRAKRQVVDAVDVAAHHLASLKSSPTADEKKSASHIAQSVQDHRMHQGVGDKPDPKAVESTIRVLAGDNIYNSMASTFPTDDRSSDSNQSVNALLMAAMAMTQLQGGDAVSPASVRKDDLISGKHIGIEIFKPSLPEGYVSNLVKNDIQYSSNSPLFISRSSVVSEEEMKSCGESQTATAYSRYKSSE